MARQKEVFSGGCSSVGRVQDCDSCCRGFEPHQPPHRIREEGSIRKCRAFFVFTSSFKEVTQRALALLLVLAGLFGLMAYAVYAHHQQDFYAFPALQQSAALFFFVMAILLLPMLLVMAILPRRPLACCSSLAPSSGPRPTTTCWPRARPWRLDRPPGPVSPILRGSSPPCSKRPAPSTFRYARLPAGDGVLLAAPGNWWFRSTDHGALWTPALAEHKAAGVVKLPRSGALVAALSQHGIVRRR